MSVQQTLAAPAAEVGPARDRAASGRGRALLVVACLVVYLQSVPLQTGIVMPVLLLGAAVVAVAACVLPADGRAGGRMLAWPVGLLVGFGLLFSSLKLAVVGVQHGLPAPVAAAAMVAYLSIGTAAALDDRRRVLAVFVCVHVAVMCLAIAAVDADIDVWQFLQQGAHALLNGADPYSIRIASPYTPAQAAHYYSPGVVVDGHLVYGYPYLPTSLLTALPGFLLGDVRYSALALLVLTTVLLARLASDRAGRALAVLGLAGPTSVALVLNAWVEPTLIVGLAVLTVGVLHRRWKPGALGLVLFLGAKQYVVVVLPLLAALRRHLGGRGLAVALAGTALVVLPFVLADPTAFYRSVVEFHLRQPFRADSVSLLVSSVRTFGWPPPSWYGPLPLLAGLVTAALLSWRMPRTAVCVLVSIGVTILVTVLLSKQAFSNYYSLVAFAFVLAAVIWPNPAAHEPG